MSLLAACGVSKSYGAVRVLDTVDFDLHPGEVHALMGENGAGKSTLIKILGGAVVPDGGGVVMDGRSLPPGDPLAVRRAGVNTVHQEFTLVPDMSVADNVVLGRERGPLLRRGDTLRDVRALLDRLGVQVDPAAAVRGLSVAHQQLIEIARALASDARVLILDEPSATLPAADVERLFEVLRRLRDRGLGIIYISHRIEEVFSLADRVTVLRDGRHVATAPAAGLDRAQLIRWMVGRDIAEEFPTRATPAGSVVLDVRHLQAPPRFTDVSFDLRQGEIVGVAGLVGAGRTSMALALAGALPAGGTIALRGTPVRFRAPGDAIARGVAYVTEDRKSRGIIPRLGAGANMTLAALAAFARYGLLSPAREAAAAAEAARRFDVRAANLRQPAGTLSGGNQQKVLLARATMTRPAVLLLDEPTRGVDVGARAEIYGLMNALTRDGLAILMISSDLPEILGMSDRIVVMREGRTRGELTRGEATPERVMALATAA
ncbi:MAG TPA: sugar ABC transporter ATP-binding protein [Vicinamibacterales bacterium]|nr:sugar ABC transporter ATP-binding protein [Vicinamibacterales bacterium]